MVINTTVDNLESQLAEVIRLYFSYNLDVVVNHDITKNGNTAIHSVSAEYEGEIAESTYVIDVSDNRIEDKRRLQKAAKIAVYNALAKLTGKQQPWGSLTGVRPTKLYSDIDQMGMDAHLEFTNVYGVSEPKAKLCAEINGVQREVDIPVNGYGLYIGIPFCVSRCSYCSFPGRIAKKGEMDDYLDALLIEMEDLADKVDKSKLFSVYIGGGTPTSLDDRLFGKLMDSVAQHFGYVDEITLEAGRPDTITNEKLIITKQAGINRICVNPQSMVDETLALIGRKHDGKQIELVYDMVRKAGFNHVNMDIIAGLPDEGVDQFEYTLSRIRKMNPESITCHSLSIKHGSKMNEFGPPETSGQVVEQMVDMAYECAKEMGMRPYYLYRQKYMAGNLENTGYAKAGYECKYNIANMGEQTTILALGTGAITKIVDGDLIHRHANPRDIFIYGDRVRQCGGMIHSIALE